MDQNILSSSTELYQLRIEAERGSAWGKCPRCGIVIATALAVAGALTSSLIAWKVFDLIPHVADEVAYDFQARIFASGQLALKPPEPALAFEMRHIIMQDGKWLSMYPPGWSLLLVPGVWLGAPWLVSPVVLFFTIIGVFILAREMYDTTTACTAVVFLTASPFVLLSGAGRMSHLPTLCLAVWCTVFLIRAWHSGEKSAWLLAGALGGAAWLVRQVSATALLTPIVVGCLWNLRARKERADSLLLLMLGAAPFVLFYLTSNWWLFGSPFVSGYQIKYPALRFNGVGTYTPYLELLWSNLRSYAVDLNQRLWGFPWPDLLLLAPLVRLAAGRKRDLLLALGVVSLVVTNSFYFWYDIVYSGPRLVFEAMGYISILAARGVLEMAGWCRGVLAHVSPSGRLAVTVVASITVLAVPIGVRLPAEIRHHSSCFHGQCGELVDAMADQRIGPNALVFIDGSYGSVFAKNDLDPSHGDRVYVRDIPQVRTEVLQKYPRNEIWHVAVALKPVPGPNRYNDSFELRQINLHRALPP